MYTANILFVHNNSQKEHKWHEIYAFNDAFWFLWYNSSQLCMICVCVYNVHVMVYEGNWMMLRVYRGKKNKRLFFKSLTLIRR